MITQIVKGLGGMLGQYKILILVAGLAVSAAGSFYSGWKARAWRCDAALTAAYEKAIEQHNEFIEKERELNQELTKIRQSLSSKTVALAATKREIVSRDTELQHCAVDRVYVGDVNRLLNSAADTANH